MNLWLSAASTAIFLPLFIVGWLGIVGWGIVCIRKKDKSNAAIALSVLAYTFFIFIWRFVFNITSSRYHFSCGILLLSGCGIFVKFSQIKKAHKAFCIVGILCVAILLGASLFRSFWQFRKNKNFDSLRQFLQQEAAKCQAPLFLSMNKEGKRLSYYTGLSIQDGIYAPHVEPLKGYAPWLNDRVYCIYSDRNTSNVCTINGQKAKEIFRDKNTRSVVFCWENPYWPNQPPQVSSIGGESLHKIIVIEENFENPECIVPGAKWASLEQRGLSIPPEGIWGSKVLLPNPGHNLTNLRGAEIRITGGEQDREKGLILSGEHSFLISLPACGGGFMLPALEGRHQYQASLRFKGSSGSRFRICYYNTSLPVTYAGCREAEKIYELKWTINYDQRKLYNPAIYVEKGSRIIFDDLTIIKSFERQ